MGNETHALNWDGELLSKIEPWYDKNLFKIGDFDFTLGEAAISSGTIIVLSFIGFAIFSYISWRKRKAIAAGAVAVRASFRKSSASMRASFRKSFAGGGPKKIESDGTREIFAIVSPKDLTNDANQQNFLRDMFQEQNEHIKSIKIT